ncbi:MAG: glycosyltransferase [Bacteroidia bacterium]|nr:glycosyltransferase [Bacteroidia bacterium]
MNILMLCDFFGVGQQYQENYLSKYYKKLGHNVVVVASTFEDIHDYYNNRYKVKKKKNEIIDGTKIIRLSYSINFLGKIRMFGNVRKILQNERPDVIFAHGIHLNLMDAVWYKKSINIECKIITDSHADFSNSGNNWLSLHVLNGIFRKYFLKFHKKHIDKLYAIVPEGMRFMNDVFGVPCSDIELLPLGCDYDLSEEIRNRKNGQEIKKKFNISNNNFIVFTGGKLKRIKKTDILIDSIKLIKNENILLLIVGSADSNDIEYENELKEMSKDCNIRFMGWMNTRDILELMSISNIAIFPASQSVLWQQSIGMHLPLVVGDVGGQDASYLNRNGNVIVIPKDNINSEFINKLLSELFHNPTKLKDMSNGAKKTAEEFLNYEIIAKKTIGQ